MTKSSSFRCRLTIWYNFFLRSSSTRKFSCLLRRLYCCYVETLFIFHTIWWMQLIGLKWLAVVYHEPSGIINWLGIQRKTLERRYRSEWVHMCGVPAKCMTHKSPDNNFMRSIQMFVLVQFRIACRCSSCSSNRAVALQNIAAILSCTVYQTIWCYIPTPALLLPLLFIWMQWVWMHIAHKYTPIQFPIPCSCQWRRRTMIDTDVRLGTGSFGKKNNRSSEINQRFAF